MFFLFLKKLFKKRLWLIGTSIYLGFDPNKGHQYKSGKYHYFIGTRKELLIHMDSCPNASCAWDVYLDYSGRIDDIRKSILPLFRRVCHGFRLKACRPLAPSSGKTYQRSSQNDSFHNE